MREAIQTIRRLAACFALLAGLTPSARADLPSLATTFGDLEVSMLPVTRGTNWHGYYEYVFLLTNHSEERTFTVGLHIPAESRSGRDDSLQDLRRTVRVGPNGTMRVSLFQPDYPPIEGGNVAVTIDGRKQDRELSLAPNLTRHVSRHSIYGMGSASASASRSEPLIMKSRNIGEVPRSTLMAPGITGLGFVPPPMHVGGGPMRPTPPRISVLSGGGMPQDSEALQAVDWVPTMGTVSESLLDWMRGNVEVRPLRPAFPSNGIQFENAESVEIWSADWLAYTRFDGIMVTPQDVRAMPPGVRTAVWQYVETGGLLLVMGPFDPREISPTTLGVKEMNGWKIAQAGYGQCFLCPDAHFANWNQEHFQMVTNAWMENVQSWQDDSRSTFEANLQFPVVDDLGVPVKSLFGLMLGFTLAIGPANYLLLARMKRRIWMLWTTPVVSLFTCLAVFGFMVISEGWEGRLRSETLTLLDESTHRATTIGWTGVYSPLTPSAGLHFGYETEVIPQRMFEGRRGNSRACVLDWSHDQHLVSGWVEARVPALFRVRKSETRRERVTLHREQDGNWSMVNGLGATIARFIYADAQGHLFEANNVAAGAGETLTPLNRELPPTPALSARGLLMSKNWMGGMSTMAKERERLLLRNTYLAEVEDTPFLEDALRNARKRKTHALVMGLRPRDEKGE